MNIEEKQNNKVFINGVIVTEAKFSHEVYGEGFYEMEVNVKRLSGQADILPVTVSERLIETHKLSVGSTLCAVGQFRSYNKLVDGKSKLMLTVFVREIVSGEGARNPNNVVLSGYICKPPVYRTTPFSREIADVLIAVNRAYNKSDYIPCIAWGRNARFVKNLNCRRENRRFGKNPKQGIRQEIFGDGKQNSHRLRSFDLSPCGI